MRYILIAMLTFGYIGVNAQADYRANFLKKWANAADYTIECAKAMPEEYYDYKPAEGSMTFKEQLLHMTRNMMWLTKSYLEGEDHGYDLKDTSMTKEEIVKMLEETFAISTAAVKAFPEERMDEEVEFFAGPMQIQQIMMLMTDHMTHHRGQILVYMRIKGVDAPKYRGW